MQANVAVGFYESLAGGGCMDTFITRLPRLLAAALAALTTGCVIDAAGVVPASRAVEVPGIQGAWKPVGPGKKGGLYITRTSPARYFVYFKDEDGEDHYEGSFLVPIPGVKDAYAASTPTRDKKSSARFVFLVRVRDEMIDIWLPTDKEAVKGLVPAMAEAEQSGVQLTRGIPPNSAEALFKLYGRAAKHSTFSGLAFTRDGWFKTNATESMTVELADAALARNDIANAVRMLDSLANRGNAVAQHRLAGMYATGQGVARDPAMTILLYKSAIRARHPQAAGALAQYLTASGLSGKPGYDNAIDWYARQAVIDGGRDASLMALRAATFRDCSNRTAAVAGDSAEACAKRMAEFHVVRAELALDAEETTNEIVKTEINISDIKANIKKADQEIKELKKEKNELMDQERR